MKVGDILEVRVSSEIWAERKGERGSAQYIDLTIGSRWKVIEVIEVDGREENEIIDIQSLSDPNIIARGFRENDYRFINTSDLSPLSSLNRFKEVKKKLKKIRNEGERNEK